ncbi:hypothetical protein [Pseudooctadecabacter jejudonensis]|uniref:Uncharacterized protein n=1 Tax=Pseudooctadecabacter jejudonensis TaxID=1391910 RepID=A0A1Y5SRC6_9RHOB|nr:hypothetical protein [Pseudooctadecabacter jejudonensis]SLN46193.1 hypothetical protein PSJ8397_02422 [Pseudooctadecabacter jejudonensis]
MSNVISLIASYAAFFGLLDAMLHKPVREKVSWYLFGFEGTDFPKMEQALVGGLVSFALPDNLWLRPIRLWMLSAISFVGALAMFSIILGGVPNLPNGENTNLVHKAISTLGLAVTLSIVAAFSMPLDLMSTLITRQIFCKKQRAWEIYPLCILLDIVLSLFLWFGFMALLSSLGFLDAPARPEGAPPVQMHNFAAAAPELGIKGMLVLGIGLGISSMFLLTLVQSIAFFVGGLARVASKMLRVNQWLALNSNIHQFPFTFLGILLGAVVLAVRSIHG